jgi:hypothetical protein
MLDRLGTNPTQFVGIIAFAAATIACLIAARHPSARDGQAWIVLALINCLFLMEVFFGFRHRIHNFGNSILMANGKYGDRGPLQEILILSFATIAFILATLVLFWSRSASGGWRMAASTSIAVLALFAIETVSLHALDAVFYRPIGPALFVGWIWTVACAITVTAALWGRSRL